MCGSKYHPSLGGSKEIEGAGDNLPHLIRHRVAGEILSLPIQAYA